MHSFMTSVLLRTPRLNAFVNDPHLRCHNPDAAGSNRVPPSSSAGPLADGRLWCSRLCINADDRVVATTRNPKAAEAQHHPSTRLGDSHNRPRLVGLRIQTNHVIDA
jgi:hypothetical protein